MARLLATTATLFLVACATAQELPPEPAVPTEEVVERLKGKNTAWRATSPRA